jgi:hypothetical protein
LRLPFGLLGYQEQATDEALDAAARLIADQEAEIARLREEVWRLRPQRSQDIQGAGLGSSAAAQPADEDPASDDDNLSSQTPWEASRG